MSLHWMYGMQPEPYYAPSDPKDNSVPPPPKTASSNDGVPQVAPPIVPAVIEQQSNSAVQYGGANPFSSQDRSALLIAAGVVLAGIAWMRNK